MCGVVAWVKHLPDQCVDESILRLMTETLNHRGPDGEGYFTSGNVGLGHKRLSILDIQNGHQPMVHSGVALSYNGEIYNFRELKEELLQKGHTFSTHCDSEVLIIGWKEWGVEVVSKLRGMFAFIIHDENNNTIFAARDRLGIKPLHWAKNTEGDLLFSSELKGITANPKIDKKLNFNAVEDFLSLGFVADPKTIFQNIYKLPPAHFVLINTKEVINSIEPKCYWNIEDFVSDEISSEGDVTEDFASLMEDAVRSRMLSDVPLGSFLSGGLDSSVISAVMQKHSSEPINTFSIGFDLSQYDESYYAKKVAEQLGFNHVNTNVSINDLTFLETLIDIYDEPFADNSAIPTYILSKEASKHVKVALSGDGADELLYGYRNHKMVWAEEKVRRVLPSAVRKFVFSALAKVYPNWNNAPKFLKGKTTLNALAGSAINSYHNAISITSQQQLSRLYTTYFKRQLGGYTSLSLFESIGAQYKGTNSLKAIQLIDFKTYLASGILTKVDRASMKNSLEVRVPFLDHYLVEKMLSVSPSLNISWSKSKLLLSNAFTSFLPAFVLKRPKMGFSSPMDEWLRQIPLESLQLKFKEGLLGQSDLFCTGGINTLLQEHYERRRDHGMTIWSLLIFNAFVNKHFGKQ